MKPPGIQVQVVDTPFDPFAKTGERVVDYSKQEGAGGRPMYRVYLRLEGPDLPLVKAVKYHLHESFKPNWVRVERTTDNKSCAVSIWMWGVFELRAEVEDLAGRKHDILHYLQYDKYFDASRFKRENLSLRAV